MQVKLERSALLAALGAILLWSSLAVLGVSLRAQPPFFVTGVALLVGSLCGVRGVRRWPVPVPTLLVGVFGLAGYHAALFVAFRRAPAVEVNLLNYLWPTLIVLLSPVLLAGFRLRPAHLLAAGGGLAGAALIVTDGRLQIDLQYLEGYLWAVVAAVVWACYSLMTRRLPPFANEAVGLFCLLSGLLCLAAHALFEPAASLAALDWLWLGLLGLGPMGGAFFLWAHAMKHGDPRTVGSLAYLTPLLSTLLLAAFSDARLSGLSLLAGALIVGGAVLGGLAGRSAAGR